MRVSPAEFSNLMITTPNNSTDVPRGSLLKQKTLVDAIYDELRGRLTRTEIGYDDRLLDYEIAAEFDCTRTPVRQALLRLVTESFLVGTTRGFVVPRLAESDVKEIFEIRRMLEPPVAANAALVLTEECIASLRDTYETIALAADQGDVRAVVQGNIAFRSKWLQTVKNGRLQESIQKFADHAQQVRLHTLHHADALKDAVRCLRDLMESFARHDAELAKKAMFDLLLSAEQHYFAVQKAHTHGPSPAPALVNHDD